MYRNTSRNFIQVSAKVELKLTSIKSGREIGKGKGIPVTDRGG
jgi:hypothetical protein